MTPLSNGLAPIGSAAPTVLILGSMPSVASIHAQAYYAHPRNAFWPIICALYGLPPTATYAQRCSVLAKQGIMVWDVIQAARREGSLDSAIEAASVRINDFEFLASADTKVQHIVCNGGKAFSLFVKYVAKPLLLAQTLSQLPSTSPAYAAMGFNQKLQAWRAVLPPAA